MRKIETKDMKELIIPEEVLFLKFGIEGGAIIDSVELKPPQNEEDGLANKISIKYYE